MTPTTLEYFASYYHINTYLPKVELRGDVLSRFTGGMTAADHCQTVSEVSFFQDSRVRQIKDAVYKDGRPRGGENAVYLGPDSPESNETSWGTPEDSLLRVAMSRHAQAIINLNKWQEIVVVPEKFLVQHIGVPAAYFVKAQRIPLEGAVEGDVDHQPSAELSPTLQATLKWIAGMSKKQQCELATFGKPPWYNLFP